MRFLFLLLNKVLNRLVYLYKQFFYFIYPNKIKLIKKRIIVKEYPVCNQIVLSQGQGLVEIGEKCCFGNKLGGFHRGGSIEFQARYIDSKIKIGNNIWTNNNIMLYSANYIEIGDNTLLGQYVTIMDHEAHGIDPHKRREIGKIGKVIIGKNVWIGNNVTILKNSEIGDNTIVATGAVVCNKFPANVIVGGVPAKVIRNL
jgi:acetyltransferase-like isoleucine patch superfamily enzyme